MAGLTKDEFDALYELHPEGKLGGYPPPSVRPPVVYHYHRSVLWPMFLDRWALLQAKLNLQASDNVVVVGAGFGWGIEAMKIQTPVTNVIGTDISDFIQSAKNTSEEQELRAAISAASLDPDTGRGAEILAATLSPGPRCVETVLNADISSPQGRADISAALGQAPNVIIFEELWSAGESFNVIRNDVRNAEKFAGPPRIIIVIPPDGFYTVAEVATYSGHTVIDSIGRDIVEGV